MEIPNWITYILDLIFVLSFDYEYIVDDYSKIDTFRWRLNILLIVEVN